MTVDEAIAILEKETQYTKEDIIEIFESERAFSIIVDKFWTTTYFVYKTDGSIKEYIFHT